MLEFLCLPLVLLGAMTLALLLGVTLRRRYYSDNENRQEGFSEIEGAIFGLLGLLLAFTFSSAAARFDNRRQLILEEAHDITTAYKRIDLLPLPDQDALRQLFRVYLESRLRTFRSARDEEHLREGLTQSSNLQKAIWRRAVAGTSRATTTSPGMLLLPSLNAMFDISSTRTAAILRHSPTVVYTLLTIVMLVSAVLAGYRIGEPGARNRLHRVAFVSLLVITYYVILDLEFPRLGLIRVDQFDVMLTNLRQLMR